MNRSIEGEQRLNLLLAKRESLNSEHRMLQKVLLQTKHLPVYILQGIHLFYEKEKAGNEKALQRLLKN